MKKNRVFLTLTATGLISCPAAAIDFSDGQGLEGKFNGTLTWGTQIRSESANPLVYSDWPSRAVPGTTRGLLQGQSGGSNLNFAKGEPISTVLKAVLDLDVKKDGVGLFLRGRAWQDFVLGEKSVPYGHYPNGFQPDQPLDDRGFSPSAQFSRMAFHEAFLYGQFSGGQGKTLDLRWGRQVLQWGASALHAGGIQAGIHPNDAASAQRPGALPAESKLPLGMLSGKWAAGNRWSLEGFAAYEARSHVFPGCGTYFDIASLAPKGCDFASLAGASEQALLSSGDYVHRNANVMPRNSGQYGVSFGYKLEPWNADVKVFAMNTHSNMPSLRMTVNAKTPGARSVNYAMVYPEDVALTGLSLHKQLTPTVRLLGEVAYRRHQPVSLNAYDVLYGFVSRQPTAVLALKKGIGAIPVGGTFDAYDRFDVGTGSLGVDSIFPKALGADRVVLLAELGINQIKGLPDTSVLRYGRPQPYNAAAYTGGPACVDAVPGKTCTSDGYVTARAWGLKMLASATYANAAGGITWTPSVLVSKDVKGYSHDGAYSQGRMLFRPALRAQMGQNYFAELQYHRYSGGRYNLMLDRDFVSVVAGASF